MRFRTIHWYMTIREQSLLARETLSIRSFSVGSYHMSRPAQTERFQEEGLVANKQEYWNYLHVALKTG
jgi:hypothetical protein